ncbi:FAD-dependent oxidoreductase [Shewanella sp. D64]|uniref:flavin monoamine oxidase family protein n=1 Tax=unclassified Shewanella TaxID=196818 RepID=UPI0022BA301A|nr:MULTISPECIES: FAD-dependent oxidoreductase [unclassified Shewanella]MEC4726637.1 FAD-dependent oxidoreductase [Shewanella sp. D64]MEC4738999.1 FAD-dependent oxidoreductase [Shewanella sp. E94]WBJ96854.1 FAD-dependent oxidoreductase [Shewanella sp. MTB7]
MTRKYPQQLDVAIIGAGVSGLYSGWRLKEDSNTKFMNSAIFDMSDRVGGRLHTIKMHGVDTIPVELGGMRFMEHQELIKEVISQFDIKVTEFPMGRSKTNIKYLRRQRFTDNDWAKATFEHRYFIDGQHKQKSPDDLFQELVDTILSMDANQIVLAVEGLEYQPHSMAFFDRSDWDKIKSKLIDDDPNSPDYGEKLENIGFWNLIRTKLSSEGFELLADGGGYYSNTLNWNSAEALPYVVGDFTGDVTYQTLAEGFDQIGRQLYNHYHDVNSLDGSGQVFTRTQLTKIEKTTDATYRYKLTFTDLVNNTSVITKARKVILAMPRRSLELIVDNIELGADTEAALAGFKSNINCVIGEPSFKLLMAFDTPWWQSVEVPGTDDKIEHGHATTDMAMRQCYYFGTQQEAEKTNGVMLASYNDMRTVSFWKPLEKDGNDHSLLPTLSLFKPKWCDRTEQLTARLGGPLGEYDNYSQAPERMVKHALNQLSELHNYEVPEPIDTAYFNWNDDPFGGGYHAWKANYKVGEMMAKMRNEPITNEAIHVCGEAYSDQQGWVEGAFCIAEQMLNDNFDVTTLIEGYYLGR